MLQGRRLPTLQYNNHQTPDCPTILSTCVPMVRAPLLDHIRQGPSIHITLWEVLSQGTGHHLEPLDSIPPPNGWAIRAKESMGGAIPLASGKQSRRVEYSASACHPCSQQLPERHHQNVPESAAYRPGTTSNSEPGRRGEQPPSGTKGTTIKGMANTGHSGTQPSSQQSCANRVPMEERSGGMVRGKKLIAAVWIDQTSPKETWTLLNQRSCLPCGVSATPPPSMDHTPHLPCFPSYPICTDKRTWRELLKAPT